MTSFEKQSSFWLSHPWGPSCPAYGGGEPIRIDQVRSMDQGDPGNNLKFSAANHIGTHMDAPRHFVARGITVDTYDPKDLCFFRPLVVDVQIDSSRRHVSVEDLNVCMREHPKTFLECDLLLIRTGAESYRGEERFWRDGIGIDLGVAAFIRIHAPNCRAVGIDSISITAFSDRDRGRIVHREFLDGEKPIFLIEDMKLSAASTQTLTSVIVCPLRIENGDGAPVTVMGFCK